MADTTNYGWTKPTVNADVDTWGGIINTAFDDADADLKTVSDASKNASNLTSGTVPAARGGAGTANGILKTNGSGTVSAATPSVDYCPASSGSSLLCGNGSGGLSNVTAGAGISFSGTTISCAPGISTEVTGLGSNVAAFLAAPSSANLAAAMTDETGSGALVFADAPALTGHVTIGGNFATWVKAGQAGDYGGIGYGTAPPGTLYPGEIYFQIES